MPLPKKNLSSIAKTSPKNISELSLSSKTKTPKTQPKKTGGGSPKTPTKKGSPTVSRLSSKTKTPKTQPKKSGGGSPKTPTKKGSPTVSRSSSKTKTPKTQPKKKRGGSPTVSRSSSKTQPILDGVSSNILDIPDDILGNFDIRTLAALYSTKKNLKISLETLDLTGSIINKTIIYFINYNLDKTKVKKLILNNIKFEDQRSFNAFIETLKSFENIKELEIFRFYSEQFLYKKINSGFNNFFIDLIENIRILQNLEKLTIKRIDIEEETDKNTEKRFSNIFLETLERLVKLKHLIFQENLMSPDTSGDINGRIIKLPNITIENSGNFTKMEIGH